MDIKYFCSRWYKFLGLILVLLSVASKPSIGGGSTLSFQHREPSEDEARLRISFLIQQTIKQSSTKLKDGSTATVMPVLPSNDDLKEVKRYGDQAVKVLATYLNSTQGMEQHVSLRFLLQFQDDSALSAVQAFAEKSKFAGVRQEAIAALTGFAPEKTKQIIERISNTDPDMNVRESARRALANFALSPKHQD